MRPIPRSRFTLLALALLLAVALVLPIRARAQSVADRTPNLSGGWVGEPGTVYFNFLHRFEHGAAPTRKISNFPTFLFGVTPVSGLLVGAQYATNSDLVASYPNEWELFGRWAAPAMGAAQLSLTGGWNHAAESVDGEASLRLRVARLSLFGVARAFSQGFGGDGRLAFGGGAVIPLGNSLALAGDVVTLTERATDEEVAWGAALQIRIPNTPHSLSLQATNTNTATQQGSSRGGDKTRWGFEFTIPLTLSRYFGGGRGGGTAVVNNADTVVVTIRDFEFSPANVTIRQGATVVWVNQGAVAHTATSAGAWDTGLIQPGARASYTFTSAGQFSYLCTPHPSMTGTVTVTGGGQ